MTFNEAYNLYMSARDKNVGKPVANNTRIVKVDENTLGVKLHNTVVVQIHNDGTYTLNNGGYLTKTTKDRINEYSPARLYQKKFEWYLGDNGKYSNGIRIDASGKPCEKQAA
jgi:hypothetical protein